MPRTGVEVTNVIGVVKSQTPHGDLVKIELDLGQEFGIGTFYFDQWIKSKGQDTGFCLLIHKAELCPMGWTDICHIKHCVPLTSGPVTVFREGEKPRTVRRSQEAA